LIVANMNPTETRLTDVDLNHLHECYKLRSCSPEVMGVLQKYDLNNDGTLEIAELRPILEGAEIVSDLKKVMDRYDTDHDGILSPAEIAAMTKEYSERKEGSEVLARWDTNNDGTLDEAELVTLLSDVKSTDTNLRYSGYTFMLPTLLRNALRYSAYVSDLGESFRPLIARGAVQATYCISWGYVLGDVAWEGYKARVHRRESTGTVAAVVLERAIFQSVASMLLPMFIIHQTVHLCTAAVVKMPHLPVRVRRWGPTLTGMAVIPFLPFMIDKPVEHTVEKGKELIGELWHSHKHTE